jgi:hypothetical protein
MLAAMAKSKKGEKMHKGPGWKVVSPAGASFTGNLWQVLHTAKGERVAIIYIYKKKEKAAKS